MPQAVKEHAQKKGLRVKRVPLYAICPSQTHISTSQLNDKKQTVKLSATMKYYAQGGAYNNVFNVVAMHKTSKDGRQAVA